MEVCSHFMLKFGSKQEVNRLEQRTGSKLGKEMSGLYIVILLP